MLFLLLKFAYILLLSVPYGISVYACWYRYACRQEGAYPFPLVALGGWMLSGVAAAYLSVFMPLAALANGILLAVAILLYWWQRAPIRRAFDSWMEQLRRQPPLIYAVFALQLIFALYLSSRQSLAYDEGLYYIQFIKWMQQYPTVPGLANLHERFGFNSHWHVLSALFNWSFLGIQPVNQLNGLLYLLTAICWLPALRKAEPADISWWLKAGLLAGMHLPQLLVYYLTAPAADLVVCYACAILLVIWMEAIEQQEGRLPPKNALFVFICAAFMFTVKVSALTLLLWPAWLLFQYLRARAYRQALTLALLCFIIVLPWCVRNVILSGYLVYPFEKVDLFAADWKSPAPQVKQVRQLIRDWAWYMNRDNAVFQAASLREKISIWYRHNLRGYDQLLLWPLILLPLALCRRRRALPRELVYWVLYLYAGAGFWFLQAPDPRFAYGFLLPAAILLLYLLLMKVGRLRYLRLATITGMLLLQAATLVLYGHLQRQFLQQGAVKPVKGTGWGMPVPYFEKEVERHTSPFLYYTPVNADRCWDGPLPCTWRLPKGVEMRGRTLKEGFYVPLRTQTSH
jgi:hypothetical protein